MRLGNNINVHQLNSAVAMATVAATSARVEPRLSEHLWAQ